MGCPAEAYSFAPLAPCVLVDDDDKYNKAKAKAPGVLQKHHEALQTVLSLPATSTAGKNAMFLLGPAFWAYAAFVAATCAGYAFLGGDFSRVSRLAALRYASTVSEHLGLLVVRQKVIRHQSVGGISKQTMVMYALVYLIREVLMVPPLNMDSIDDWAVEILSLVSPLMVLEMLRWMRTYKATYQEDIDVLKVKHLVPACIVVGALIHPDLHMGGFYDIGWSMCLYLDVLALMPQVVMMSRGGGKVAAPIAHFVAATTLSRCTDLAFWYYADQLFSLWTVGLIVTAHAVHLLLVADFMYYYLKARVSGSSALDDVSVSVADDMA